MPGIGDVDLFNCGNFQKSRVITGVDPYTYASWSAYYEIGSPTCTARNASITTLLADIVSLKKEYTFLTGKLWDDPPTPAPGYDTSGAYGVFVPSGSIVTNSDIGYWFGKIDHCQGASGESGGVAANYYKCSEYVNGAKRSVDRMLVVAGLIRDKVASAVSLSVAFAALCTGKPDSCA